MVAPFACLSFLLRKILPLSACIVLVALLHPAPLRADSVLNFPRLVSNPDTLTGVAIVNPTATDAQVNIFAYGADGTLLAGPGVTNPATITVPANQQFSKLTSQLFGDALPDTPAAWFQATSTTDGLTGFFLFLNSSITLMDGADVPTAAQQIIFNNIRIDSGFTTELDIINPGSSDAHITLRLAGTPFLPGPQFLTIPSHGAVRLDAASYFAVSNVLPGAYVIVDSDSDVAGLELVQSPTGDAFALNARQNGEQLASLYFLQNSVLGNFQSSLSLVNYSGDPVVVTITAYKPDGTLFDSANLTNNPVTRALNSESSLSEDVASMFGFSGSSPLEGWLQVKATSNAINGFISYGDTSTGSSAAVTSPPEGQTRALFSQIATSSGFFTGLALLNPGSLAANVRILAIQQDGTILGVFDTVLEPSQRFKRFLGTSDLIPQAANQSSGIIFVKSSIPIYMSVLIGSDHALVNIPSQPAPDAYNPDASIATLKMNPPIAIVPPGASQRFTVAGAPSALTWKVNGAVGGATATGVISSSGVFTAPKSVPARQVVTITGESSSQSAGASADVLDKVPFLTGLAIVQSVTYLDTLGKVYSAELAALSSAPSLPNAAAPTGNSQIFEISTTAAKVSLALFPGEFISKIIPFTADNGTQYLLLAAQTSGQVIRLDPVTKGFKSVVTGLNQPAALVIDSKSGDLLIVEQDKITTVSKSVLQADLAAQDGSRSNAPELAVSPFASLVLPQTGGAGIAVDRCTGFIFFSLADQGTILEYRPALGTSSIIASGLNNPGQLLALYRTNVTCPDSFHLLVADRGNNRIVLVIPQEGIVVPWLDAPGIIDLSFLPTGNPDTPNEGILFADHTVDIGGIVYLVPLTTLYDNKPPNPPAADLVEAKTDIAVSQTHSPEPVAAYEHLVFTLKVSNNGPSPATGVTLADTAPPETVLISVTGSQGSCGGSGGIANCNLGHIPVGGSATVTVTVAANYFSGTAPETVRNIAVASSIEVDTNPSNNISIESATVTPPQAVTLNISGIPASVASGTPVTITVTLKDKIGFVSSNYTGTVHFSSSDSSAWLPSNYTFLPSDAGSHTFTVKFRTSGSQTLSVQDTASASLAATKAVTVLPASFSLSAAGEPAPGVPFTITVIAKDVLGNVASNYTGTVAFTSSDTTATLPANYTFTSSDSGSHTFSNAFTLRRSGSQTITVSDTTIPSVTGTMTFSVGVSNAVSLQITALPVSITAGSATTLTVRVRDALGNTVTGYTGSIRFTTADTNAYINFEGPALNGYTSQFQASDNGTQSLVVAFYRTGNPSISVADTVNTSVSGSTSISVVPGAAFSFELANLPSTVAVGASNSVTVRAVDVHGNTITGYTGTIHFSSSDSSATLPADYQFVAGDGGSHAFPVTFNALTCETSASLIVADTVTTALTTTRSLVVAGPAYTFRVELTPSSPVAGVFADIKVTALDVCSNGNVAVGFTGTISFNTTDSNALPNDDSNYTFTLADAGVHNFTGDLGVQFQVAGPQTITVTGAVNPGIWSGTVLAGPATSLQVVSSLTFPANPTIPIDVTVTALDQFGNIATGYVGTIHFTTSDPAAASSMPGDYTFLAGDNGVHVFTLTLPCNPFNGTTITATDTVTGTITGTTLTIFPCGG